MRHRGALTALFAAIVFVGVMLVMLSTEAHLIRHGLPIALLSALGAGFLTWRWSEHQS